jgi:hypothetical protein
LVRLKPALILGALALALLGPVIAKSQECPDPIRIEVGEVNLEPCSLGRVSIPVFMTNPCSVGGLTIRFHCTDPAWLNYVVGDTTANWDTVGSRISNWEAVDGTVSSGSPGTIQFVGIADMPGGADSVCLPPGTGLLVTLHPRLTSFLVCDTSQIINLGSVQVSNCDGYTSYHNLDLVPNRRAYILPGPCGDNPRGDANCSGTLNGIDVVYLVQYLKGVGPSFCCLCSGDANGSGTFNGIDVTFLVAYFKGGPPPPPCP